jgi:hypothetical protein
MRHVLKRPSPAMVVACLSLFVALSSTTYAATGGNFILGQANTATWQTALAAPIGNKSLQVTNKSTAAGATALGLNVAAGKTPFTVNSGTKVTNLNADKLDGLDSSALRGARAYALSGGAFCPGAPVVFCPIHRGNGVAYVVKVAEGKYCVGVSGISAADPKSVALLSVDWGLSRTFERMWVYWNSTNQVCVSTEFEVHTRSESPSGTFFYDDQVAFSMVIP